MKTVWMQCKAEVLRLVRNKYYLFSSLLMPIMFYYIFTNIVKTGSADVKQWQAHYLMSMAAFSVMGSSIMSLGIRTVQERVQGFSTLMRITPLPGSVYFFAKMVGQTVIHMLSVVVIFAAGALINGVELTASEWILSGLWIVLGAFPFLALGTLIGTMRRVDTAIGVSNVLYLGMAIIGGMWMPMDVLPKFMQQIGQWLPSYHFGSGAWRMVAGDMPGWNNIVLLVGYLLLFMVLSSYIRRKQEAV